jgi:regulator of chromosome condensation
MDVGGMHCIALTHDNKIYTWGVNDIGALGRPTGLGKILDLETATMLNDKDNDKEDSDSDSDSDEDEEYLNPSESEPKAINPKHFPEGTEFAKVAASDSASWALTTDGFVYGWGAFRVSIPLLLQDHF